MPTKQRAKDEGSIAALIAVHGEHPFYGVRRFALHLGWNQKKARRIRSLAEVTIAVPGKKRRSSQPPAEIAAVPNALKRFAVFRDENRLQAGQSYAGMVHSGGWVQDFTHLRFRGEEHYLAVVLDLRTRQVVGWRLGLRHTSEFWGASRSTKMSPHSMKRLPWPFSTTTPNEST